MGKSVPAGYIELILVSLPPHQVRATNLQELVYKNGQAGITKASVTIVFDNSDKNQAPLGYENFDELTITRQVKKKKVGLGGIRTHAPKDQCLKLAP